MHWKQQVCICSHKICTWRAYNSISNVSYNGELVLSPIPLRIDQFVLEETFFFFFGICQQKGKGVKKIDVSLGT